MTTAHTAMRPPQLPSVALRRRQSVPATHKPAVRLAALRVPLVTKLFGANLLVVGLLLATWLGTGGHLSSALFVGAAGFLLVNLALVLVALRPIRDLEEVASRVWHGDFGARVDHSVIADNDVLRIGSMFNLLLDGLESDRARMRALASEVIAVGDRERAALARELHDSTAQRIAALLLQISAAARDCADPALRERLVQARDSAEELTEEVRLLSHTLHPRVLDDLGLVPALRKLARDTQATANFPVDVDVSSTATQIPQHHAAVLYRVAQEAVRNAVHHASPSRITVSLRCDRRGAHLEVRDDGRGFDADRASAQAAGLGLRSMRERVALVDGTFSIATVPGTGTIVTVVIPSDGVAAATPLENEQ